MTFHVGQKVVCIDDSSTHTDGRQELSKNQIYTVSWCGIYDHPLLNILSARDSYVQGPFLGVQLKEIGLRKDDLSSLFTGLPFRASRFRPLVERRSSTDISFALDILDKANRQIKESTGA